MSAVTLKKTLLEAWIGKKLGKQQNSLTREEISQYQLEKVKETIYRAYKNSPFYRDLLKNFVGMKMNSLEDLQSFPFTASDQVRENSLKFLCVSQSEVSRVVTLDSSGTTGKAKRIYFTKSDQELTVDFFQQGMSSFLETGDSVLILLPGQRIGSIGDLLVIALKRGGANPVLHGVVKNIPEILDIMVREEIDSLVGIPVQVLALARYGEFLGKSISLKSVLLSTDHVPRIIVQELQSIWGCQVFEHYGMTEMGLGGGLHCEAHRGYHLREADLYFEIVDKNGKSVPDGQEGEVVFTTLTRQGMPLIRYCTGDISRFLLEPCSCGTILKRLERITKRKDSLVYLSKDQYFTIADLDERIFAIPGVVDFTVEVDDLLAVRKMTLSVWTLNPPGEDIKIALMQALNGVSEIYQADRSGRLLIRFKIIGCSESFLPNSAKRKITELEDVDGKPKGLFD
jgi:phenylacetate-CoA ligase